MSPPAGRTVDRRVVRRVGAGLALLTFAVAFACSARAAPPPPTRPYDAMARSYGVYLDPADPLAWPAKVRAIARDEFHYWRGTRDLYYAWCAANCRDWLDDTAAYTVSHNDPHWGNLGRYAAAPFGTTAEGLVDFDESARTPFQFELLSGVITFDLIARENGIDLTADRRDALHAALFDAYAATLARPRTAGATDVLTPWLTPRDDRPYADDLKKFTQGDRFRTTVLKKNAVTDLLRPCPHRDAVAAALADAVQHDARLAALLRPYDTADFDASILDVVERVRVDSSGSQGLKKILVLLRRPFRGRDFDGILYLKQQIPSAPERAGLVPPDPRPPAVRYVRDLDVLTHGQSLAASWCEFDGRQFWVSVKEPWSDEPDSKALTDADGLTAAARAWATLAADSHRNDAARLAGRVTLALRTQVVERAAAYLAEEATSYAAFTADPRTRAAVARFEAGRPR